MEGDCRDGIEEKQREKGDRNWARAESQTVEQGRPWASGMGKVKGRRKRREEEIKIEEIYNKIK